ncbi:MAG: CBS domain-containing protein [Rhodobacteraceae bacterium]|nr:CBS domain-containing protein [Paracoccaceae bacterium]
MIIKSISQILDSRPLWSITPDTSAREACVALSKANVGALAVMDDGQLIGVLSERDVIKKCVALGRRTDETLVRDIMTADPVTVTPDATLADALKAMLDGAFRHLPVVQDGQVKGMLSMRDIPTEYRLMFERYSEYRDGEAAA